MSDTLGEALERAAKLYAGKEAVVDGDTRWTYAELHNRVGSFDAALDAGGVKPGDAVAVLALNSSQHLVCWLTIPRSGRVLVDLNVRLAVPELQFVIDDSQAKVLIVDDHFLEAGKQLKALCPGLQHTILAGTSTLPDGWKSVESLSTSFQPKPYGSLDPETTAGIFYTGGTTGLAKGAMLSHRNLVSNAKQALISLRYTEDDVYLHAAPMFHLADGASTYAITWIGGKHVIQRAFEPAGWLALVSNEKATCGLLVPTMVNMVINHPAAKTANLGSLRQILYGASPMPVEMLKAAMKALPCEWLQGYGMTEASPILTVLDAATHKKAANGDERSIRRLASAGRAIVGVEVEVRREDGVTVCGVDEPGELYARGPNIMKGYFRREPETKFALVEGGWYRSGDAALMDDEGFVFIVDRLKDMIISGGENVYSTEVENALYKHPAVLECAVFGVPSQQWGETVHATVVLKPGAAATADELITWCRTLIAGYKLPRSIDFIATLPKSGAGKILKRELRKPFWVGTDRQVS